MKNNILYLFVLLGLIYNINAQEFGFINMGGNPKLENLVGNDLINTKIIVGKTYNSSMNSYNITTLTNDIITLKFACDTAIKLNENSSFNIDTYEQANKHTPYPQQTIYDSFNCQTSLINGEAEIINNAVTNDTNSFYVNTKLACIVCGKGKFVVRSEDKSSTFIIVEGNASIMDNMSRKLYKVKQNDIITITPRPVLNGRAGEMMRKQNIVTSSTLDISDYNALTNEFTAYDNEQHRYIFITIDSANKLAKLKN
jgi:hypothetical protein